VTSINLLAPGAAKAGITIGELNKVCSCAELNEKENGMSVFGLTTCNGLGTVQFPVRVASVTQLAANADDADPGPLCPNKSLCHDKSRNKTTTNDLVIRFILVSLTYKCII
jgi:hypothetical protein